MACLYLIESFPEQKFLIFVEFNLLNFYFMGHVLMMCLKSHRQTQGHIDFSSAFFWKKRLQFQVLLLSL